MFTRTKHTITDRDYRLNEIESLASPAIWSSRMLNALRNGVKRGKWYSLHDKMCREQVIDNACDRVLENKGKPGVDKISVHRYADNRDDFNEKLLQELKDGSYWPSPVRRVNIPKPGSKEKRPLGIPTIKDRIVQTALKDTVEPIFDSGFSDNSFGFRPGRGCKDALREVVNNLKEHHYYIVDADIKSYFDTINHKRLLELIREKVSDGRILDLIELFLKQGVLDVVKEWTPEEGSPQGAVMSPLLANIYLNPLDWLFESKGIRMVRYADDFIVMCKSMEEAESCLEMIREWMAEASLTLHPDKTRIADLTLKDGYFEFLGYHFEHTKRDKIDRWPRKSSMKKFRAAVKARTPKCHKLGMEEIIDNLKPLMRGWYNYFKHSNQWTFKAVDGYIRRRLRSILRKRSRRKGISKGKGMDHHRWKNSWFKSMGYESLLEAHLAEVQSLRRNC